jgi:hypothetical protein
MEFNYLYEIENGKAVISGTDLPETSKITKLVIPSEIDGITVVGIAESAFHHYMYDYVEELTLPHSLKTIGEQAFDGIKRLRSLDIPESVDTIGKFAFAYCSSLEYVKYPRKMSYIPNSCFYGCRSLETMVGIDNIVCVEAFGLSKTRMSQFPFRQLVFVGDYAFTSIKDESETFTVSFGPRLQHIGTGAFHRSRIDSFSVDKENELFTSSVDGVLFTKDMKKIISYPIGNERTSYSIPKTVTIIGDHCFAYTKLERIENSPIVEVFEENCFSNIKNRLELYIPAIARIQDYVFSYTENVTVLCYRTSGSIRDIQYKDIKFVDEMYVDNLLKDVDETSLNRYLSLALHRDVEDISDDMARIPYNGINSQKRIDTMEKLKKAVSKMLAFECKIGTISI